MRPHFADLPPLEVTTPEVVLSRLPKVNAVLGPAGLFYPSGPVLEATAGAAEEIEPGGLGPLLESVSQEDLDESGLVEITSTASVIRATDGKIVAACGYRRWPNGVAHLSVLVHPDYRREGHGLVVGAAAIARASEEGLLPQWRARPFPSRALAQRLNLALLRSQLSLRPS